MSQPGLLLLGTDTGVGKTSLAVGLLRLAHRRGFRLVPYKPVETGCDPEAADARRLWEAALLPGLTPQLVCPLRFTPPLAPSVAARLAGVTILPEALAAGATPLRAAGDALLVESAGGLLTPYGANFTSVSLAELLAIDVLLVSSNRLGTINHTALAIAELNRRRVNFAGLVLVNVAQSTTPDQEFNATEITTLTGVSPLGTLRYCSTADPDALADLVTADVALGNLFGGALR